MTSQSYPLISYNWSSRSTFKATFIHCFSVIVRAWVNCKMFQMAFTASPPHLPEWNINDLCT